MTEAKTIGRKRKKNGFTQISNSLLEDNRLSWKAKGILSYLMSRPDNWKVNKVDIQRKATEGRDSVNSAIQELKEFGYLHIYKNISEKGQFDGWIWEYDDVPFTPEILKNRNSENPQDSAENVQIPRTTVFPNDGFSERRFSSTYNNTGFNNTNNNNTDKEKGNKNISPILSQIEREFETLWKMYPRKMGKAKAMQSYIKARKTKKTLYETVEKGLYRYNDYLKNQGIEEQFIMHGSTWFNGEKWLDEYSCISHKKPKSAMEYLKMQYGEEPNEFRRDETIIEYYP
jgi:hypothetical protein